jgi:hydrogenase maturation protease
MSTAMNGWANAAATTCVTTAPVLVLGLGNTLLADDGAGIRLMEMLAREYADSLAEFVDGGTQGLALIGYFLDRSAILVLDAVELGAAPGTIHVFRGSELEQLRARRAGTAHESSALELFETARLLGYECGEIAVVGIEPACLRTGMDLMPEVESALGAALTQSRTILDEMMETYVPGHSR